MRHIALEISYDGTSYAGWQIQKNAVTVQSVIQDTLGEILKKKHNDEPLNIKKLSKKKVQTQ